MKEILTTVESIDNKEAPKTVLEYLAMKHGSIVNDYCETSGEYRESCGLIAIDIAKLLLQEGMRPYIMSVSEDVHEKGIIRKKTLSPTIYNGRVNWGGHQVCCCNGIAYDPIVGAPVDLDKYSKTVFGEDINMEILIPQEKIEEFVSR